VETNGYADLRWTTAQEIDNDYFEVYKLTEETEQFVVIGIIDGQGTTKVKTTYQFIDKDFDSDAYYQIRQVDFDGQSETFGPIALSKETSVPLNLEIYPNPSSGPIQLSGSGYTGFSIHKMRGQLIRMEPNRMGEEAEEIINSALLSSKGTFFLTFWNGEEKVVKRIIKR
ncbi:MAG: T9SS type A sorting domain-containing protein, partial [Marinoscillum sp.]